MFTPGGRVFPTERTGPEVQGGKCDWSTVRKKCSLSLSFSVSLQIVIPDKGKERENIHNASLILLFIYLCVHEIL